MPGGEGKVYSKRGIIMVSIHTAGCFPLFCCFPCPLCLNFRPSRRNLPPSQQQERPTKQKKRESVVEVAHGKEGLLSEFQFLNSELAKKTSEVLAVALALVGSWSCAP